MTVEGTSKITLNPENKHKGREGKTKTEFPSQGLEIMSHIFSSFPSLHLWTLSSSASLKVLVSVSILSCVPPLFSFL